jgi:Uncharacterized conserved protein
MNTNNVENLLLDRIAAELVADGYDVFREPQQQLLPEFLAGFTPDAIAIGKAKNLVIELVRQDARAREKLRRIQEQLKGRPEWELRVVVVPASSSPVIAQSDIAEINEHLSEIDELIAQKRLSAALLIAWATFEAIGRRISPTEFGRPQTPGRLVEVLARDGEIMPDEADLLRRLAELRNHLIHGVLHVAPNQEAIEQFAAVLKRLSSTQMNDAVLPAT